jgi:cyanophycin synthetase
VKVGQQFLQEVQAAVREACPDGDLGVESLEIYLGANPFSVQPAIVCGLRAKPFDIEPAELRQRLTERFRRCFPEKAPAFATAADAGELVARFAGRLASALLSEWLEIDLGFGVQTLDDGTTACWIEFPLGTPAGLVLKAALVAVCQATKSDGDRAAKAEMPLSALRDLCEKSRPNFQSRFLIGAARKRGIPYFSVGRSDSIWQFGWGNRSKVFIEAASDEDGLPGFNIAKNKTLSKYLFRDLGLPTPRWMSLAEDQDPALVARTIGWPCVVKPVDSCNGEGITAGISNVDDLEKAVTLARRHSSRKLLIEAHEPGQDYRLMIVDGHFIAGVRKEPPMVTGNGRSTVRELLAELNSSRTGTPRQARYLSVVAEDAALEARLSAHGLTMTSVLAANATLALRSTANRSTGGICVDVTDQVHPQPRLWAEQLARTVGLRAVGIDYITPDIGRSHSDIGGGFIEINATPGLGILAAAGIEEAEIGSAILGDYPGRIPVTLIIVADEARDETWHMRMEEMAGRDDHALGSSDRAVVGGGHLAIQGRDAFDVAVAMLRYRSVSALTLIWSPAEIYRFGLPVDQIEKAIIVGTPLPDEWMTLLRRISGSIMFAEDARISGHASFIS